MGASLWDAIEHCQRLPITGFRNNSPMTLGSRIKEARAAKGWARRDLAEAAGVPYATLAGIENSDQASSTATPQLAATLGVSAVWLATGKGPMKLNESQTPTPDNTNGTAGNASHLATLDSAILCESLVLLEHDEGHGGKYSLRDRAVRLSALYALVFADGGRLTKEHNAEFERQVRARKQGVESGDQLAFRRGAAKRGK